MDKQDKQLDLKPITFNGVELRRPIIIAGPCSAETEEQVMNTATELEYVFMTFMLQVWRV